MRVNRVERANKDGCEREERMRVSGVEVMIVGEKRKRGKEEKRPCKVRNGYDDGGYEWK